jgi:hypothetical protein
MEFPHPDNGNIVFDSLVDSVTCGVFSTPLDDLLQAFAS